MVTFNWSSFYIIPNFMSMGGNAKNKLHTTGGISVVVSTNRHPHKEFDFSKKNSTF